MLNIWNLRRSTSQIGAHATREEREEARVVSTWTGTSQEVPRARSNPLNKQNRYNLGTQLVRLAEETNVLCEDV